MSGPTSRAFKRGVFVRRSESLFSPSSIAAVLAVIFHSAAQAQSVNYTSATDPNLGNASNWQSGTLPTSATIATLGQGVPAALTLQNTNLTAQSLVFTPASTAASITLSTSGGGSTSLVLGGLSNDSSGTASIDLNSPNTTLNVSGSNATVVGPLKISVSALLSTSEFTAGANAGSASIQASNGAIVIFDSASAANANLVASGIQGEIYFQDGSNAATSVISVGSRSALGFLDSSSAGSAHIVNAGETTFAGSSTAGSAAIINSGLLSVANAATLGQSSTTNSGDTEFTNTASAGNANVINTGTLAFHDQTTASAATISNTSSLSFADSASAGSSTITNASSGAMTFSGTSDASMASIANAGSIDLSLMQQSLSIGSLNGSGAITLGGNDLTLGALGRTDSFSGVISGAGGLNKTGTGILTLSGANLYAGATTVQAGILDLSGSLASPIMVTNQATLTGAGSTSSNLQVLSGGSFQPGGAFHVGGNLLLSPQSQFVVAVTPTAAASSVTSSGSATINAANLSIQASGVATSYAPATTYTILSAAQGVSGTFNQVAVNLPLLSPSVHYAPDDVTLTFTQLPVSGGGAGTGINSMTGGSSSGTGSTGTGTTGTGSTGTNTSGTNTSGTGTSGTGTSGTGSSGTGSSGTGSSGTGSSGTGSSGTDNTGSGSTGGSGNGSSSSLLTGLDNLNETSLGNAISSLGASSYGAMRRLELEDADEFPRKVADHLYSQRTLDGDQGPGWVEVEASRGSEDGNFSSASWDQSGLIGGLDLRPSETTVVGLTAQYLRGSASLGNGSNGTSSRIDFGVEASLTHDNLILDGMLSYGQHQDDVRRYIAFANYREGPNANSGGDDFTGRAEVATRLEWNRISFMPYASLQWTMANADSFQEGGGAATNLYGDARRENLVTTSLGIRARSIELLASTAVGGLSMTSISGGLAWVHQSGCLDGQVTASFLEDQAHTPFISTAGTIGADRAEASLALDTTWTSGWHLQLRLSGDAGHAIRSAEAYAGVGVDFN